METENIQTKTNDNTVKPAKLLENFLFPLTATFEPFNMATPNFPLERYEIKNGNESTYLVLGDINSDRLNDTYWVVSTDKNIQPHMGFFYHDLSLDSDHDGITDQKVNYSNQNSNHKWPYYVGYSTSIDLTQDGNPELIVSNFELDIDHKHGTFDNVKIDMDSDGIIDARLTPNSDGSLRKDITDSSTNVELRDEMIKIFENMNSDNFFRT